MSALSNRNEEAVRALARRVREAFEETVRGFSLRALVREELPPLPPKRARVRVVAAGKSALSMMLGALDRWPGLIERGLAVTVHGSDMSAFLDDPSVRSAGDRIEARLAAHPYPDESSAEAARAALELFGKSAGLQEKDLALVLISGGASSLLSLPPEGMTLEEIRELVRALLESGATIRDVNLVRRHLSQILGGRLAKAAAPARVLSLVASDVIGGAIHDIGSGPSVPDPTTVEQARSVLERFAPGRPQSVFLQESLKLSEAPRWRARVVASPSVFAERLAATIGRSNARAIAPEEGDARAIAKRRIEQAEALAPGEAIIVPCEPTLRLPKERGRGGRAGWVALRALLELPEGVVLLCGATDGVDGSSGAAGAVVTALDREVVSRREIERALAAFDDASAHARLGSHLPGAPSGVNVTDVHVLARVA